MDLTKVREHRFPPITHQYTSRDTILYALGLGYGEAPTAASHLTFVYEENLKAIPSMSMVLAHPGFWAKLPEFAIDWVKILHGEQSLEVHRPLPAEGVVRGEYEIEAVDDKGPEKGAVLYQIKRLYSGATDDLLATVRSVLFMRGDGGCGSWGAPLPPPAPLPEGQPDRTVEIKTLPQQALMYRLSGDYNPIHADPAAATRAGFAQPILHGLCTMGVATRALIETYAPGAPERLKSIFVRFSKPVYPGETIVSEFFDRGGDVRFRCRVKERDVVVLDRASAGFR